MPEIIQEFTIKAPEERVFQLFATPAGLATWWAKEASGDACVGGTLRLYFGPEYDWRGRVTRNIPPSLFEIEITQAHPDWMGTRVRCELSRDGENATRVRFYHTGWPEENEHWRVSCFCWAMYLRVMRRYIEHAEMVPYERRLEV